MCGITGITITSHAIDSEGTLKRMTRMLAHRGPDDEGYFFNTEIGLGHRRLSIIDIAGGHQPMENGRYVIIFNGEIYNYQEIRDELLRKGVSLRTKSDTEALLEAYAAWGAESLQRINGMFAYAIYDKQAHTIFIARDRLGIKPLYYALDRNGLVFASEIKAILSVPGFRRKLNKKVLNSYFQYRYIVGEETFFEGIKSVPPGYYFLYDIQKNKLESHKYWQLPLVKDKQDLGEDYYIEKTRKYVRDAVKRWMISDVPVGAYLSGGLDSSIVTAIMAELKASELVETFTIGFKEEGFNEFEYARIVANKFRTHHHEILLSAENYLDTMEELIAFKDAPLAVPNEIPLYLMSKELKKYITVVLSGEGADELFGGYGRIFISPLEFQRSGRTDFLEFFLEKYNYVSDSDLEKFMEEDILDELRSTGYTYDIFRNYFERTVKLPIEDRIPYVFQNIHLQGLLQRVDTTTMATAIEARVPFVDHELVEFVNSIPFKYKIRWKNEKAKQEALNNALSVEEISERYDITKYLLRQAFTDYIPPAILERKKVGFPVPLDSWFRGKFSEYAKEILLDPRTLNRGIYRKEYLQSEKFLQELSGINIWMMINLELFLRKYFD